MTKKYKIITGEYEALLFDNYALTDLMILKKNGRNIKSNGNSALYQLLRSKLEEYGLSLFGSFIEDGMEFRGLCMLPNFPPENEEILKQCYGFENFKAHVQLRGFDDFATAFDYNTSTGECELQRHSWGTCTNRILFKNLKDMLSVIEGAEEDQYDEIFS